MTREREFSFIVAQSEGVFLAGSIDGKLSFAFIMDNAIRMTEQQAYKVAHHIAGLVYQIQPPPTIN